MMKNWFNYCLIVLWIITLVLLMMNKGMPAMYLMVIGMLADEIYCILKK